MGSFWVSFSLLYSFLWVLGLESGQGIFGLTLLVVGIGIFILATPADQLSSKPRAFAEWTLTRIVWVLTALIILTILTLH